MARTTKALLRRRDLLQGVLLFAGALAFTGGCGLSDYSEKVQKQQAELQKRDEADKLLGDPVDLNPNNPDVAAVFFRPPRGVKPAGVKKTAGKQDYYHYERESAAGANASPFREVVVAYPPVGGDDFAKQVKAAYQVGSRQGTSVTRQPTRGGPLQFEVYTVEKDNVVCTVHLCQRGGLHLGAIIYCVDKDKQGDVSRAMDASLDSFTVGDEVPRMRKDWDRRKGQGRGATAPRP